MRILGVDPGENTGFALMDYDPEKRKTTMVDTGVIRMKGRSYQPALDYFVKQASTVDLYVVEDYIINPKLYGHDHQGDKGVTLRLIGALEVLALQSGTPIVLQMPTVKPPGYGFLGLKYQRGKKDMHGFDAMAHIQYYLVSKRLAEPLA